MRPFVVVLAGGTGSRLWPASTPSRPKFLLPLGPRRQSTLANALERALLLTTPERVLVLTGERQSAAVRLVAANFAISWVVAEPEPKDTAASLCLANILVSQRDPQATLISLPGDHWVDCGGPEWRQSMALAIRSVEKSRRVTLLGVRPSSSSSAYGYMEAADDVNGIGSGLGSRNLRAFHEKPEPQLAETYASKETYFWNTAIMCWKLSDFDRLASATMPKLQDAVAGALIAGSKMGIDRQRWASLRGQAIDFAMLEPGSKLGGVAMVQATFDWRDLGTWPEVIRAARDFADIQEGPTGSSEGASEATAEFFWCEDGEKTLVVLGLADVIVVDTPEACLVARIDALDSLKDVVSSLASSGPVRHKEKGA